MVSEWEDRRGDFAIWGKEKSGEEMCFEFSIFRVGENSYRVWFSELGRNFS